MRNPDLDQAIPEDSSIGELHHDEEGRCYRMVAGRKIYQIEEQTQRDVDMNRIINRCRVSGMSPTVMLKFSCR